MISITSGAFGVSRTARLAEASDTIGQLLSRRMHELPIAMYPERRMAIRNLSLWWRQRSTLAEPQ